ncbi:MAG TPA: BamA/TamA family outer membrane protein, partial [Kofleriaceae bacterium]|nr:BamA/TamA family outer membrane protein [Kofleriaceae bacterium]
VLRALAEEVRGDLDEIPFVDLPRLGGPVLLRGYPRDRFRDRAMALASAEYLFDLGSMVAAYLFVDAGRVAPHLADLTAEDARVGYGGGLQIYTNASLLGRLNLASSIDGGLFVSFRFDPVYQPQSRVERD